jgi:PAS domain S-box-containing protein
LRSAIEQLEREIVERNQAQEALAEHAALVQDLYNNAPCGYHSLDADGVFVQINQTELTWLGYTREEVEGRLKFPDLLTPESLQTFQANFPDFKEKGWVKDLEYDLVRKDGTVLPVLLNATAIKTKAGHYLMSRATLFDITERRRAQEALESERRRLYALLDSLPAYIYLQGKNYTLPFVNRVFKERFGDPMGRPCYEVLHGRQEPCEVCTAAEVFETFVPQEREWTDREGRTYQLYDYPFADIDGSPMVLEMGIDITDRMRAEETIREQGRQLEAFFAHSLTPTVFLDEKFNFLRVNLAYARACQRHPVEFQRRNHFELYPHAENETIFRRVVETKRAYVAEARAFEFPDHPEWGVTYWDWALFPVLDEEDEVDFLVFSLNDVTERVKAQEALQESEEKLRYLSVELLAAQESERKRLAAELHDEMGHGLLTIKLQLRSLERRLLPEQQDLADDIEFLVHFIGGVLDNVRRLYFDLSPGNLEDLGLTGAVRQMIDEFAKYNPGIRWRVRLANLDREFPLSTQTVIYRVMQELLNNIGKHAGATQVTVVARRQGNTAHLSVEDDGRGFDLKKALSSRKGLGLAAMEERLRLVGGSLEILSQENRGARISFTIPLTPGERP